MQQGEIFFSVVIPLYNKVHYIGDTIRSVLNQTYANYEIVVVDDGSTDGSYERVCDFAESHPQIKVLRQKNQGVSVARNKGIDSAQNDYIAFLDADDVWDKNCLETFRDLIEKFDGEYAFAVAQRDYLLNNKMEKGKTMLIRDHCKYNYLFQTSCICVRKSVFDEVGMFKPGAQTGEDRDCWLRISCRHPFVFCNKELVLHPKTTENNLGAIKKRPAAEVFPYWEWYGYSSLYAQNIKRYASGMILWQAFDFYKSGQYEEARRMLKRIRSAHHVLRRLALGVCLLFKR